MNFIYIGIFEKIGESLKEFFFNIIVFINSVVYSLVSLVYQIFLAITQSNNILNGNIVTGVVNRLYIILSVVVLFVVAYSLLKSMINPDESLKGKKSPINIIKDVIISVVLIALTPTIFDFAFDFQNSVLQYNTIGKIIAGAESDSSKIEATISDGGYEMAAGVWQAFIYPNDPYCKNEAEEKSGNCTVLNITDEVSYGQLWKRARENTTFFELTLLADKIISDDITYLFPFDLIAGVIVLFVLVTYCLDMAIRLVKLSIFELIAPIPIMARIIPDEKVSKVFSNWLKATLSTFAEVFIRIAILYLAVIIIATLGDSIPNAIGSAFTGNASVFVEMIAQALIIIGIVLFVKQAPGIIKDITGLDSNKYNVLGSAMKGFNGLRLLPKVATQSWNNTEDNPNYNKFGNGLNRFKNALFDTGKALTNNYDTEYKGLKDANGNYDKVTGSTLAERRRKEAIRKAKRQNKEAIQATAKEEFNNLISNGERPDSAFIKSRYSAYKADIDEYLKGSVDTKAAEAKIKATNAAGKDIKSKIIDEAIDKNLSVKRLDNAWKALQAKAVDANEYFERITAENYEKLGLKKEDIGNYYDASTGTSLSVSQAQNAARTIKEQQEGELKKQRDNLAFATMWGAINGDYSMFDSGDVDTSEKQRFVTELFSNLQTQFNTDIEYAKANNPDVGDGILSQKIDAKTMATSDDLKKIVGDKKLAADTLVTKYTSDQAKARAREQLNAEIKGDK